ncbi:hypothetical protein ACFQ4K_15970 [Tistrella bauzanensis]
MRSEPLPADRGLPGAARQMRILYTATDGVTGDGHVVVSGALFVPGAGRPPAAGRCSPGPMAQWVWPMPARRPGPGGRSVMSIIWAAG